MTGQWCTWWVQFGAATIGGTVVTNNPTGMAYFTASGSGAGVNSTVGNITWYGQSSVNNWWLDRGYFIVVRIA